MAIKDDIIPLSEPITTVNGEVIDAIPVKAGQWVSASLCGYNRYDALLILQCLSDMVFPGFPLSGAKVRMNGTRIASCVSTQSSRPELVFLPICT